MSEYKVKMLIQYEERSDSLKTRKRGQGREEQRGLEGGTKTGQKKERDSMANRWQGREGHAWKCQQGVRDCASDA